MRQIREALARSALESPTDVERHLLVSRNKDFLLEAMWRETEFLITSTHTGAVDELVRINEEREEIEEVYGHTVAERYPLDGEPW